MATFAQRQKVGLDGRDIDALTLQNHAQQWLLDVLGPDHEHAGAFAAAAERAAASDSEESIFSSALKNGQVLCHLINRLHQLISTNEAKHLTGAALDKARADPNSAATGTIRIKKIHKQDKPFKKMENITSFLLACREYKLQDEELFTTADLFHQRNTRNVVAALHALSRRVEIMDSWKGPVMGEKWVEPEEEEADTWQELYDDEGRKYLYNPATGETKWAEEDEETKSVEYYNKADWEEFEDEDGRKYYYNSKTGETTWDPPPGFGDTSAGADPDENEKEDEEEEDTESAVRSGREKVRKFNIGHIKVHDSVISDYAVLKARRGRSWMILCIESEENVVFCEDSGDAYGSDVDLCKALLSSLPSGQCRYAIVDVDKLLLLSWIPPIAPNHHQMQYASQIGTLQHAGGGRFTSFRGLQEIKTKEAGDVRIAILGEHASEARRTQRRVLGRSSAGAVPKKKTASSSSSKIMASGRKTTHDSSDSSDEEWDPDA